jgi:hypothetical protein
VSLIRRDGYRLVGPGAARRSRKRECAGAPRSTLEILETRILLFAGHLEQSSLFLDQALPTTSAVVGSLSPPATIIHHETVALFDSSNVSGPDGTPLLVQFRHEMASPAGPPTYVLLSPEMAAGSFSPSSSNQGETPADVAVNVPVFDPQAVNRASIGGSERMSSPTDFDFATATSTQSGIGSAVDLGEGANSLIVPDLRHVEVDGTLSADHTWQGYQIPVGPTTMWLQLSMSTPDGSNRAEAPVFEQMSLLNPAGRTVGELGPGSGQGVGASQDLIVWLRGAPAGDQLLVQIGTAASATGAPGGSPSVTGPVGNWIVPYVLNVQRDEQDSALPDASPAQGQVSLGTLVFTLSPQGGGFSFSQTSVESPDATGATALNIQQVVAAALGSAADGSVPESSDGYNVRVSTGPLASRSAGPLGPILASSEADLAPPVDRHERALFQEIEGLPGDDGTGLTKGRYELTSLGLSSISPVEPGGSESNSTGGTVVAVSHGGGFPLMMTASGHTRRTDRAALLASVPATPTSDTAVADAAQSDRSTAEVQVALAEESHSSTGHSEVPDYVKAACGLALGLGLTSGPLFPDLLTRAPARLPKWLRSLRAMGREGGSRQ